jgi:hypothetical protein
LALCELEIVSQKIDGKTVFANKQLYFAFQLHFSATIATSLSPCYSRDAFSKALIHDVTSGLNGLVYISRDTPEDGFALGLC